MPALNAYIESLLNSNGRFRTLREVVPVTDGAGYPLFTSHGDTVSFSVRYNGGDWRLYCPLRGTMEIDAAGQNRLFDIRNRNNPHIAPCEYLPQELAVYDAEGNISRSNVILCFRPEGLPLPQFVRSNLYCTDRGPLRSLLRNLTAMAAGFQADNIVHGNLRGADIIVTPDCRPVAAGIALAGRREAADDALAFLLLQTGVFLAACEPELYRLMGGADMFSPGTVSRHLRNIAAQAQFSKTGALEEAAAIISRALAGKGSDMGAVKEAMENLANTPFAPLPLLLDLIGLDAGKAVDIEAAARPSQPDNPSDGDPTLRIDFAECEFVGEISDTLIRFRKEGLWGFADRHGAPICADRYLSAEDFYEGRAKVESAQGCGLIDRDGKCVMAPEYEELVWYGRANVAAACRDGLWMLYDRQGRALSAEAYDWIAEPEEGFMVVRAGGKCGYVSVKGQPLTALRFDETYSFADGRALVSEDGEHYYINLKGEKID